MKRKYQKTLELIFARPVNGSIKWKDIESLFRELGGSLEEGEGSRVGVRLKGAVSSIRRWLDINGVKP
jgi:hypothetical protein